MKKTLLMDVKVGQTVSIDDGNIIFTIEEKSGQRVKIRFVHHGAVIERAPGGIPPDGVERRRSTGAAQAMLGIKAS
jgi:pyruvate kinase